MKTKGSYFLYTQKFKENFKPKWSISHLKKLIKNWRQPILCTALDWVEQFRFAEKIFRFEAFCSFHWISMFHNGLESILKKHLSRNLLFWPHLEDCLALIYNSNLLEARYYLFKQSNWNYFQSSNELWKTNWDKLSYAGKVAAKPVLGVMSCTVV